MRQAVGKNRLEFRWSIPGQGIAHLDRRRQVGRAVEQNIPQILPGMHATTEEQRDPPAFAGRDHSGREQARALGLVRGVYRRVVVVPRNYPLYRASKSRSGMTRNTMNSTNAMTAGMRVQQKRRYRTPMPGFPR